MPHDDPLDVTIRTGKLALDLDAGTATVDGKLIKLTSKEFGILKLLCQRKNNALTKELLLNHLYGTKNRPDTKIIDVFVCNLRRKLSLATGGENYIETLWGRGYVLRDPAGTGRQSNYGAVVATEAA